MASFDEWLNQDLAKNAEQKRREIEEPLVLCDVCGVYCRGNDALTEHAFNMHTQHKSNRQITAPVPVEEINLHTLTETEKEIIQFVKIHGQIVRKDMLGLCGSSIFGGRMLQNLAKRGILEMKGRKRGAKYVLGGADGEPVEEQKVTG